MANHIGKRRNTFHKALSIFLILPFIVTSVVPPRFGYAQLIPETILNLPVPGTMVSMSKPFIPAVIKGLTIHPENPLRFDFIVDRGASGLEGDALAQEGHKLVKYFLATLTVPEKELWVNLSPYERGRIIPDSFGRTEMGRDLLAQDYMLKQLSASLMYPEEGLGRKFWDGVYKKAYEQFGTTEIPMNTFNKIWIIPERALVYEHDNQVFIIQSHLKVMLEEDYIALQNNLGNDKLGIDTLNAGDAQTVSGVSSAVVKEILIPEIEKEVNEGETFANLRQIYQSVILATWYKLNLKESLLGQVYIDQNKTKGIDFEDKTVNEKIYNQYIESFKKGVYNYIKEDVDPLTQEIVPRKYFSGGTSAEMIEGEKTFITGGVVTELKSPSSFASPISSSDEIEKILKESIVGSSSVVAMTVELADVGPKGDLKAAAQKVKQADQDSSSPVVAVDRKQVLKRNIAYYSDNIKMYINKIKLGEKGAEENLVEFLDEAGKIIDQELWLVPVEAAYPALKAVALLDKEERQDLLKVFQKRTKNGKTAADQFESRIADAILLMFDIVGDDWIDKNAPHLKGRVIHTHSAENSLIGGGLGYVMQVIEKGYAELGARVVSTEVMYENRKGLQGELIPVDYERDYGIKDLKPLGDEYHFDIAGNPVGVRYYLGWKDVGGGLKIEKVLITEIPEAGKNLMYTNVLYEYHKYNNHSQDEFTAFYAKAALKVFEDYENARRAREKEGWRPAVAQGNDSQMSGLMLLLADKIDMVEGANDKESVFWGVVPAFTTHTFGNRHTPGMDQLRHIIIDMLGAREKWLSAAVRFNVMDMASLALRVVEEKYGLASVVSEKQKAVLDRRQYDPNVQLVANSNGDDLDRAWSLMREIYKEIYGADLNDPADLKWDEARAIVKQDVENFNKSFQTDGIKDLGLDPEKPTYGTVGRAVNEKMSPFRMFTENNILRSVANGYQVVMLTRVQSYPASLDLAEKYRRLAERIAREKKENPELTKNWGTFVFVDHFDDRQKQLMMLAMELIVLDSDDETGTNEYFEVNGAAALTKIMGPPWLTFVSDDYSIDGEGAIATANVLNENYVSPKFNTEKLQRALQEEKGLSEAMRYGARRTQVVKEVEDVYYETVRTVLQEAIEDPQTYYAGLVRSVQISRIGNGLNTSAGNLRHLSAVVQQVADWREEITRVVNTFGKKVDKEKAQTLLNEGYNGAKDFWFHIPRIAGVTDGWSEQAKGGLKTFLKVKKGIEGRVWDGPIDQLKNGDYIKYFTGLLKGVEGNQDILDFLNKLQNNDRLKWTKKDRIFTEFVVSLVNEIEKAAASSTTSKVDGISSSPIVSNAMGPVSWVNQPQKTNNPVGGIDFNPEFLDLQIKRDGNGVPLPMNLQPIETMHIEGFIPIIINVTPVDIPLLLGEVEPEAGDSADPLDLGYHAPPAILDPRNRLKVERQLSFLN